VIGNPPYIRMESFKELKIYLKSHYEVHDERSDLYAYIIERGHKILNKDGVFGMIISNKFLRSNYGKPLRDYLAGNTNVNRIVDFAGLPVFTGATVRTIILLTAKDGVASNGIHYSRPVPMEKFEAMRHRAIPVEQAISEYTYTVSRKSLVNTAWSFTEESANDVLAKARLNSQRL
jgi:hypothetical protein